MLGCVVFSCGVGGYVCYNVCTDAALFVVDFFQCVCIAVGDIWNKCWKGGIVVGIGSNLSRELPSGVTSSQLFVFMPPHL